MASAISPHSLPPPPPGRSPQMTATATVLEQNAVRMLISAQRLKDLLLEGAPPSEIARPCILLARSIDYALSMNDAPQIASQLPSLVKQVYQHRNDASLQSAITMLMIAVKNACRFMWFFSGDSDELLKMANELLGSLCTGTSVTSDKSSAMNIISKIIPRFYPQLKLGHMLLSFEAKVGYNILFSDYHIDKRPPNGETIRLFVAQTDDLETSSCLISPADVSFLVNGVGVKGRNNVSLDKGSQLPTDITKMLKRGTNIIQIAGIFRGNYIIAIAFMSKETDFPGSNLQDYVQPAITALAPGVLDPEVIEGPSRISLNCPISLRRIEMPVKGYRCKHLQCFDYGNFLEINSRKPSWRCPLCDQPACFIDLRIDQNMVKVLQDVTVSAVDVVLSADGSWKVVSDHDLSPVHHHLPNGIFSKQQHQGIGSEFNGTPDTLAMDLTMDEDERSNRKAYEIEDCKPFKAFPVSESFPEPPLSQDANVRTQGDSHLLGGDNRTWSSPLGSSVLATTLDTLRVGTLASLVPPSVLNPVITGVISPASGQEATASLSVNPQVSTFQITSQAGLVGEYLQIQPPQSGNSIINLETERQTIPRQISRIPSAIQAHPEGTQACSSYQLTQPDLPNSCFNVSSNLTSVSYLTSPSTAAARDALSSQALPTNAGVSTQALSTNAGVSSSSQRAYPYLMSSGSNITGCSPIVSHQKISSMTAISGGDIEMRRVSSGLDDSMLQQLPSMSQNQNPGCQSFALQQGTELPTSTQVRTMLSSDPRTTDAYSSRQQPQLNHQNILNHQNNIRGHQNFAGIPVNSLASQYAQLQAAQRAAQMAWLPTVHPYASTSGCTFSTVAANPQPTGVQQLQNTVGQPVSVSDHNWRPMGRMRGSLSGNEYNAALNHYLSRPSQLAAGRPSAPTSAFAPDRLVGSNSNVQANRRNSGLGNYTGI